MLTLSTQAHPAPERGVGYVFAIGILTAGDDQTRTILFKCFLVCNECQPRVGLLCLVLLAEIKAFPCCKCEFPGASPRAHETCGFTTNPHGDQIWINTYTGHGIGLPQTACTHVGTPISGI